MPYFSLFVSFGTPLSWSTAVRTAMYSIAWISGTVNRRFLTFKQCSALQYELPPPPIIVRHNDTKHWCRYWSLIHLKLRPLFYIYISNRYWWQLNRNKAGLNDSTKDVIWSQSFVSIPLPCPSMTQRFEVGNITSIFSAGVCCYYQNCK